MTGLRLAILFIANDGTYTIASLTDSTITTVEAITTSGVYSLVNLNGTTQINAIDFYPNLIENNSPLSFTSLTDNQSICKQSASKTNWVATETVNLSQATQSDGWRTGNGTVIKNTDANLASNYRQEFLITHSIWITPLYLSGDTVILDGRLYYPSYFLDTNSLKYVARIDGRFDTVNPTAPHTTPADYPYQLGNIGWFDEFLNGGVADYTLTSVRYVDLLTGDPVTEIQIDRVTVVIAVIHSASGRFTGTTKQAVNFFYCPDDQSDYVSTKTTDLLENFRFDHKLINSGAANVNGINYGTDYQALTNIASVIDSANQLTLTFSVDLSQQTKTFLKSKDEGNRKYILAVTPQRESSTMLADTDRNAVLIDFNLVSYDLDDSSLLSWRDILFYQYPDTTTNSYTDYKGVIGDHILTKSQFNVKNTGTPINLIAQIQVVNSVTGESFNLEQYTQQFPESEVINGAVCDSVAPTILQYNLLPSDPRNQAYLTRNVALDTSSSFGYEFNYGFVARYEEWRQVQSFDSAFACDHAQDWSIYSLKPDWDIKFIMTVNVLGANDHTTEFKRTANLTIIDDSYSNDGFGGIITSLIQTFYTNGSNFIDAKGLIFSDQNTHVKMTLTGDFSALPASATGYYAYLALDVPGTGGEFTRDICTSEINPLETSAWNVLAVITQVSATEITIESDIDYTKLDLQTEEYLITGRFGFKY